MVKVMIGVDPHKGSRTAIAIDPHEQQLGQVRATRRQVEQLLGWASEFGKRRSRVRVPAARPEIQQVTHPPRAKVSTRNPSLVAVRSSRSRVALERVPPVWPLARKRLARGAA